MKSTVPVGTAARVAAVVAEHARHRFHVCSNPEFLKEGTAVEDFLRPDRVVIGADSDHARGVMAELYAPFVRTGRPILFMDVASAEMTKYAANGILASRISYMNEIAMLCELVGANVDHVRRGVGADSRIGPAFLFPGPGYGGSCFPKDVRALIRTGSEHGATMSVLHAVHEANERQRQLLVMKIVEALAGAPPEAYVAVWGLTYKPQTDDLRDSPALAVIDALLGMGIGVIAHDPIAVPAARRLYAERPDEARPRFASSSYDALDGAHALVITTDWNEYRHPDFARIRRALAAPVIVDARNLYDVARMMELGFRYHSIGRPAAVSRPLPHPAATASPPAEARRGFHLPSPGRATKGDEARLE